MDEPSATLTQKEVMELYSLVDDLKSKGIAVIYVSHRLEEVERLADRAVVMRDGEKVGELKREELDRKRIIELMVGRSMDQEFPEVRREIGKVRLRAIDLHRGKKLGAFPWKFEQGRFLP